MLRKLAYPLLIGWAAAAISAGLEAIDGPTLPVDELAMAIVVAVYAAIGWAVPEPITTVRAYLAARNAE